MSDRLDPKRQLQSIPTNTREATDGALGEESDELQIRINDELGFLSDAFPTREVLNGVVAHLKDRIGSNPPTESSRVSQTL